MPKVIRIRVKRAPREIDGELDPAVVLALATKPLLEMFALLDDIFTEDGALLPANRQKNLGHIYSQWKKCRKEIDPEFNSKRWRQHGKTTYKPSS